MWLLCHNWKMSVSLLNPIWLSAAEKCYNMEGNPKMKSVVEKHEKFESRPKEPTKRERWEGFTWLPQSAIRDRISRPQVSWELSFSQIFATIPFAPRPSLGFQGHAFLGTYTLYFLEAWLPVPSSICRTWRLIGSLLTCSFLPKGS